MSYYAKHRRASSKRPVLRAVAASTALVLLVLAGTVFLTYRHLEGNITVSNGFDQIVAPRPDEVEVEGPKKPLNILLLGSDTREGQTEVLGQTPGLSDTTILLHLSADRERAYGVSIPRDLIVSRPDCTGPDGKMVPGADVAQWNEAYALGGEACTIAQFEEMSKLRVNHFVVVDFNGFKDMVDALGGVPVCVPEEVNDPVGKIYLPAGSYEVTGNQALNYVRVRNEISDNGDIGRMKRQQTFLAAMVNKAVSAGTLFNPPRLVKFLNAGTKSLTTDPGLAKLTDLFELAQEVRGIGLGKVQFLTVPIMAYEPDPNRLALAPGADALWEQLRMDEPLGKELSSDATKASQGKPGSGQPKPEEAQEAEENGLCA
ncbi:MAG: Cell envelope-associated transcriptional attenuator LytR-CpsA-Psr, subfamily A1 [uncultured Nocardioidaceae bacterium]|uniref:Cell envelope-associated transcriptional attenuator LytR-CpsA-Psr, subfamily A1 n=1 Tax=uncultured Nocardioidaceae bacterium TaxID=253824 RepID=A0A6J4N432_9ACTN|nr:MAG: Cell envelope-associated transcriptional attenuator LytR-CpsA-Psr, subfamily A1 [uncultured Nocardioidaceae bacterium]